MPAALRRRLCAFVALALLCAQMALAAYACAVEGRGAARAAPMSGTPCEEMMTGRVAVDADQPALCFEHCKADTGQQPSESTPASGSFAPALALLFVLPLPVAASGATGVFRATRRAQHGRAPPEPHSILHCCWRV
jgi:hypothetical protein